MMCGHTFHFACLNSINKSLPNQIKCPQCDHITEVNALKPNNTMIELIQIFKKSETKEIEKVLCECGKNTVTKHCSECRIDTCDECDIVGHKIKHFQNHNRVPIQDKDNEKKCLEHNSSMKVYCCECKIAICRDCRDYGKHKGHETILISDAISKSKEEINSIFNQSESKVQFFEKKLIEITQSIEKIRQNENEIFGKIDEHEALINEMVKKYMNSIKNKVKENSFKECNTLEVERNNFAKGLGSAHAICDFAKSINKNNSIAILNSLNQISEKMNLENIKWTQLNNQAPIKYLKIGFEHLNVQSAINKSVTLDDGNQSLLKKSKVDPVVIITPVVQESRGTCELTTKVKVDPLEQNNNEPIKVKVDPNAKISCPANCGYIDQQRVSIK